MFDNPTMLAELTRDEGIRNYPYVDTTGNITIGVGRNLSADGLSNPEVAMLLADDLALTVAALDAKLPWWTSLDDVRQRVLVNMCFNLGIGKLLSFVHFLAAVKAANWPLAVVQMQNSLWAKQVGVRAVRLEQMILTGAT